MTNEHRRSAQWMMTWRPLVLVLALVGAAVAAGACEETGPSPIGVHPNDAGPSETPEEDAGEEAGEPDAEAEDAGEDAGDAGETESDAGDAGDGGDADADAVLP